MRIHSRRFQLAGIYIPPTDDTCYAFLRPIRCGPRAILALEFKIGADFVHCEPANTPMDSGEPVSAYCRVKNGVYENEEYEDLAEWMLQEGWAVALPGAPPHYAALEKIARVQGRGVWGLPLRNWVE